MRRGSALRGFMLRLRSCRHHVVDSLTRDSFDCDRDRVGSSVRCPQRLQRERSPLPPRRRRAQRRHYSQQQLPQGCSGRRPQVQLAQARCRRRRVVQAELGTAEDNTDRVGPQLGVELLPPARRGGRAAPAAAPSPAEAPAAAAPAAAGEPDDDEQPDGARIPDLDDVLGWGGGKGVGGLSGDRLPAAWGARSADMCARMPQK